MFCVICGSIAANAQTVDENRDLRLQLDTMFSGVDKSKVPTQFLLDYAIDLVDLSNYDGSVLTDSNYISLIDYENILRSIRSACVSSTMPFMRVGNLLKFFTTNDDDSSIKMSIALYKYNRIKANALTDGLIEYNESSNVVSDKYNGDEWIDPYEEDYLLAFALNENVIRVGTTYSLKLVGSFSFSNITNVTSLLLDAGDGLGWRRIIANTPISLTYDSAGEKEIKLKIATRDQRQLLAHTKLLVEGLPANNTESSSQPDFIEYQTRTTCYNGIDVSAKILLSSANSGTIKKPFIFIEGFDPGPFINSALEDSILAPMSEYGFSQIDMIYDAWDAALKAKTLDYDLIYIDWENSLEDIRANAALLEKILNEINEVKHSNGSQEKNILMGHSMGGLISRYTLCAMESRNTPHEVTTYVSYDSPHLGANVPLGALYFIPQVMEFLYKTNLPYLVNGISLGLLNDAERALYDMMHAQSVKQMLMNYVDTDGILNNSTYNEWQHILNEKGFPQGDNGVGINNLAIANGGKIIGNKIDNKHYLLVDGYAKTKTLTEILLPILSRLGGYEIATSAALLNLPFITDLLTMWGSSMIEWHAEINPLSKHGASSLSNIRVSYTKKYLWLRSKTFPIFNKNASIPSNIVHYADDYYSSYYNISRQGTIFDRIDTLPSNPLLELENRIALTNRFAFVPTSSALCYKFGENPQYSDFLIDFYQGDVSQIETPFDAIFLTDDFQSHVYNNQDMFDWIFEHTDMKIVGEAIATSGTQYTCLGVPSSRSTKWSTSNPAIAQIDENTGILTAWGNGEVDIIAKTDEHSGNFYGVKRKVQVGFPKININTLFENNTGYTFTSQFTSQNTSLLTLYNNLVNDGTLRYEWSFIDGDGNMTTKTTSSNVYTYMPQGDEVVTIVVRLVDNEGNKSECNSTTINLRAPFDVNYRYVVVDSYQNTYFVKSDDTYEIGTPTEQFAVTFRNIPINPTDNALSTQLKQNYLKGNVCYLGYPVLLNYQYWKGTKVSMQDKWRFSFFNTTQFLNLLNDVLNDAGGEESSISVFPMVICNTEKEKLQSVPFAVIYKPTFPEN